FPQPSLLSVSHASKYRAVGNFSYALCLDSYSRQVGMELNEGQWN
ncbi:hypothetical protein LCGC14_3062670, partial [marine sediment metagenome]